MAYEPRLAVAFISSSGAGGAKIMRRTYGELLENVAAPSEYHWMAGNFLKYAGPLTVNDLPVDAHQLVALCAPRPVFISSGDTLGGVPAGDGWVDAKGMFLAGVHAGPVYRLLGKKDLGDHGVPEGRDRADRRRDRLPPAHGGAHAGAELADVPDLRRALLRAGREAGGQDAQDQLAGWRARDGPFRPSRYPLGRAQVDAALLSRRGGAAGLVRPARRHRRRAAGRLLQAPHRQAESDVERIGRRSALLRLGRRRPPQRGRRPLHHPLHAAPQGQPLEPDQRRQGQGADRGEADDAGRPRRLRSAAPR